MLSVNWRPCSQEVRLVFYFLYCIITWYTSHAIPCTAAEAADPRITLLRSKFTLLGKEEWWWLMDESLAEIGEPFSCPQIPTA